MGKKKLKLPHLHVYMYQIHVVFRFNPRSRCNSCSHAAATGRVACRPNLIPRDPVRGGESHPEMPSSPGSVGVARAHPLTKAQAHSYGAFPPDSVQLRPTLPVGVLVLRIATTLARVCKSTHRSFATMLPFAAFKKYSRWWERPPPIFESLFPPGRG